MYVGVCECVCVCVVQYANNVVADMKPGGRRRGGGGVKPALGQRWYSVPSLRLNLSYRHQQQPQRHQGRAEGEEERTDTVRWLSVSLSTKQVHYSDLQLVGVCVRACVRACA